MTLDEFNLSADAEAMVEAEYGKHVPSRFTRTTMIEMMVKFHLQNFCKPDVVRCKELLELRLSKEQELADINSNIDLRGSGQNYRNIEKIRMAMMLIEELPAL